VAAIARKSRPRVGLIEPASIAAVEREIVRRRGLAAFVRLAWPHVEPGRLVWGWHIDAIAEHLEAVSRGEIRDLLILVPPGHMKSLTAAVFWPAWEWISRPSSKFIFATYSANLTRRDAVRNRNLINSAWFQERFGNGIDPVTDRPRDEGPGVCIPWQNTRAAMFFENNHKGFRYSTSTTGEVTGRHGNRLVFDDLVKAQDAQGKAAIDAVAIRKANDFWFETMATRGLPEASRVGVMQRLHFEDTASKCIDAGYTVLELPAEFEPSRKCIVEVTGFEDPRTTEGDVLWPAMYGRDELDRRRASMGALAFESQYQQRPTPKGGAIFKAEDFQTWGVPGSRYPVLPRRRDMVLTQSWDMRFGDSQKAESSFVVGQLWGQINADHLLLDQVRGRWDFVQSCEQLVGLSAAWPEAIEKIVERKANGEAVRSALKDRIPGIVLIDPEGGKDSRAFASQPYFRGKNVFLPPEHLAPWRKEYEAELLSFPLGRHDDQVDATTQYLVNQGANAIGVFETATRAMNR